MKITKNTAVSNEYHLEASLTASELRWILRALKYYDELLSHFGNGRTTTAIHDELQNAMKGIPGVIDGTVLEY